MYMHGILCPLKVDLLVKVRLDQLKSTELLNSYVEASYDVTMNLVFCTFGIVGVGKGSSAGAGTQLSQLTL